MSLVINDKYKKEQDEKNELELDKILKKYNLSKPVFSKKPVDLNKVSTDVLDMLSFFKFNEHSDVVKHTFGKLYSSKTHKLYQTPLYSILVPKKPSSKFLPMLCAHTDTVGNVHPTKFSYTDLTEAYICNSQHKNLGADDRLGCYLINKMLKSNPNDFIFALFDLEETGGQGSDSFSRSKEFKEICEQTSCFLGLDRRGDCDMASYGSESDEFLEEIRKIPTFIEAVGSFTDVATLAEESNISCVNFSVGYYGEHSTTEKFSPTETLSTLDMLQNHLPKSLWEKQYTFEDKSYGRYGRYYGIYSGAYGYNSKAKTVVGGIDYHRCDFCGITHQEDRMVTVDDDVYGNICEECWEEYYGYTQKPFEGGRRQQEGLTSCEYCGLTDYKESMVYHPEFVGYLCKHCSEEDFLQDSIDTTANIKKVCSWCETPKFPVITNKKGQHMCEACCEKYTDPETFVISPPPSESAKPTKGVANLKVKILKFLDVISNIVDEAEDFRGNETVAKQAMRDINLLSYYSKFECLKEDQAEKVRNICEYYGYEYII